MLRKLSLIAFGSFLLLLTSISQAQDSTAFAGWEAKSKKTGEGKFELTFSVAIQHGWQLYAPNQPFLDIKTTEIKFEDSAIVQQGDFVLVTTPKEIKSEIVPGSTIKVLEKNVEFSGRISIPDPVPARLHGVLFYTYGKGNEFYPSNEFAFTVELEGGVAAGISIPVVNKSPVSNCGDDGAKGDLLTIFLLGLVGGLIALLTPCMFPMIPVTVTFFTKKSESRKQGITKAVLYGVFIFLIYVLFTIPFHVFNKLNPEVFNNISTNVWLNLIFFAIFVTFALSFFGLFEIVLPSSLANRADSKSGFGDILGIFFMAATLAIVSFSCTGPIFGTLLANVVGNGAWPLTVGAAGFGLALGLPFALFAMFPGWLQSLPKSGGWMTDVKVVLGFIEIALAVKFLSNADLVMQWGILKREIFIGIWILIGILIVLYLVGAIRIAHSSPVKKFSMVRICFIVLFGVFTVYLIPGLTNTKYADLKLISGFPPPRTYSLYKHIKIFEPIHNDLDRALQIAQKENKPVLIDFTGWGCVNCRRMEDKTWPDPLVSRLMQEQFIVVSLYVDEKVKLPAGQRGIVTLDNGSEKSIVSVGDLWATFQSERFGAASQPQYAIIGNDTLPGNQLRMMTKTKYYTPGAAEFGKWLQCGLDAYKSSGSWKNQNSN